MSFLCGFWQEIACCSTLHKIMVGVLHHVWPCSSSQAPLPCPPQPSPNLPCPPQPSQTFSSPALPCRTKSIFDAEVIRPSRQSQEEVLNMQDSHQLADDLVIDIMADSVAPPLASSKSVIYTAGQQFLLAPGAGAIGADPVKALQSAESETSVVRTSQSIASDTAAVDQDQQGELLLGTSVPTTENLAQLQQHHSAAEEDLIRAHPAASPRSTFWGEESRYTCKCPLA